MSRMPRRKLSKKEQKAAVKEAGLGITSLTTEKMQEAPIESKKQVTLPGVIAVKDFAEKANLPVTKIIAELMKNGVLATINETIDFDTAAIVGDDLGLEIVLESNIAKKIKSTTEKIKQDKKKLVKRPPVVAIMGHVDHGKTTLLDYIRKAHVAASESGGITQHISAYQLTLPKTKEKSIKNKTITFIDTPGHAAFSAMREHGTVITDIIVLIVAANDGVKPQTKEVIEQAKQNNVPIIVAINKVDLPEADIMKTKQQLSEFELIPEDWGGKTIMVEISAKTGKGVDNLLEMILLQSEMMNLLADPKERAVGVVIESHMHKGAGAMALVLIENGTLKKGDPIAIGGSYGKVRILQDYTKKSIEIAGPSFPTRIAGLKSVPNFGEKLIVFDSEKEARESALKSEQFGTTLNIATAKKIDDSKEEPKEILEFDLVLKCDVKGSLEAINKMLSEIKSHEVVIKIISNGVGPISESDVTLAKATNSVVIGFRTNVLGAAKKIAKVEKISIKNFDVIYQLIDYIKETVSILLPPEIIEEELGHGEILAIFRDDKKGFVVGGRVNSGKVTIGNNIKILQKDLTSQKLRGAGNEKYRSKILSLRKEKSGAKEVESGTECGFGLPAGANVAVGDTFIAFKTVEKKRSVE